MLPGDLDAEAGIEAAGLGPVPRSTLTGPMLAPMWAALGGNLDAEVDLGLGLVDKGVVDRVEHGGRGERQEQPQLDRAAGLEAELASGVAPTSSLVAELEADRLGRRRTSAPRSGRAAAAAPHVLDQAEVDGGAVAERGLRHGEGFLQRGRRRARCSTWTAPRSSFSTRYGVSSAGAVPSWGARVRVVPGLVDDGGGGRADHDLAADERRGEGCSASVSLVVAGTAGVAGACRWPGRLPSRRPGRTSRPRRRWHPHRSAG